MSKIAVVYWSGTGNTEAMAAAVVEGAKEKGAEVSLFTAAEFSPEQVSEFLAEEVRPVLDKYAGALAGKSAELKV